MRVVFPGGVSDVWPVASPTLHVEQGRAVVPVPRGPRMMVATSRPQAPAGQAAGAVSTKTYRPCAMATAVASER